MAIRRAGLNFDGSTVHITVGKIEIPVISESHGDNVKKEFVWKLGAQVPEADTPGQYEPEEGSIKMTTVNARTKLFPALARLGAAGTRVNAVITMFHPDIGDDSDLLEDFSILGGKQAVEASSKSIEIEFKTRYRLVRWTRRRICFGNPGGTGAVGSVRV